MNVNTAEIFAIIEAPINDMLRKVVDGKTESCQIELGCYKLKRIPCPIGHPCNWLIIDGTENSAIIGMSEGAWREQGGVTLHEFNPLNKRLLPVQSPLKVQDPDFAAVKLLVYLALEDGNPRTVPEILKKISEMCEDRIEVSERSVRSLLPGKFSLCETLEEAQTAYFDIGTIKMPNPGSHGPRYRYLLANNGRKVLAKAKQNWPKLCQELEKLLKE